MFEAWFCRLCNPALIAFAWAEVAIEPSVLLIPAKPPWTVVLRSDIEAEVASELKLPPIVPRVPERAVKFPAMLEDRLPICPCIAAKSPAKAFNAFVKFPFMLEERRLNLVLSDTT